MRRWGQEGRPPLPVSLGPGVLACLTRGAGHWEALAGDGREGRRLAVSSSCGRGFCPAAPFCHPSPTQPVSCWDPLVQRWLFPARSPSPGRGILARQAWPPHRPPTSPVVLQKPVLTRSSSWKFWNSQYPEPEPPARGRSWASGCQTAPVLVRCRAPKWAGGGGRAGQRDSPACTSGVPFWVSSTVFAFLLCRQPRPGSPGRLWARRSAHGARGRPLLPGKLGSGGSAVPGAPSPPPASASGPPPAPPLPFPTVHRRPPFANSPSIGSPQGHFSGFVITLEEPPSGPCSCLAQLLLFGSLR